MAVVAYKAFKKGLVATLGKGSYQYKEGVNEFEKAHCASCGAHCAEDPLDMFNYYHPGDDTEYRLVIASGDIHEDGTDSKISCTRLIVKQELTIQQVAAAALLYWRKYPSRSRESFELDGYLKMKRGKSPVLKGKIGEILCFAIGSKNNIERIGMIHIDGKRYMPEINYNIDGEITEGAV